MTQTTYYAVISGKRAYIVKYAQSPNYEIKLFSGAFESFAEANKQFKEAFGAKALYTTEGALTQKAERLATQYQQDLKRMQSWLDGKGVGV